MKTEARGGEKRGSWAQGFCLNSSSRESEGGAGGRLEKAKLTGGPGLSAGRERGRGEPASWAAAQEEGEEGAWGGKGWAKTGQKERRGKE